MSGVSHLNANIMSDTPVPLPEEAVAPPPDFRNKAELVPLEWQHASEKKQIPMELLEFQKGISCTFGSSRFILKAVKKEMQAKEQMALEIMKMPDYQFYHWTLRERIDRVEQK